MTLAVRDRASGYLAYLPALYQELDGAAGGGLGRLLLAFEQIFTGLGAEAPEQTPPGMAELLGGIERYLTPGPELADELRAPKDFLPWLGGWFALTLEPDWDEAERRRFIGRIVSLYRMRGTRPGLIALLRAYTNDQPVEIVEFAAVPHYFQVRMTVYTRDPALLWRKQRVARQIIEREKPAHTYFTLDFTGIRTLQVGRDTAQVGVNTFLGDLPDDAPPFRPTDPGGQSPDPEKKPPRKRS
ncbi:MAG TPA: phage tail protein [Chloroflexaceae bacterium]|nr:phage tail protein [Chloroflexaceae bacterium]